MTKIDFSDYRNYLMLFLLVGTLLLILLLIFQTEVAKAASGPVVCNIPIVNTAPNITILSPFDNFNYSINKVMFNITTSKKSLKINTQINGINGGFFNLCNNCSNYTKIWELNGSTYQMCVYAIGNETNPCSGELYYNTQCINFKMNNKALPKINGIFPENNTNVFRSENTPLTVYYSEDNLASTAVIFKSSNEFSYTILTKYNCISGSQQECTIFINTTKYPANSTLEFFFLLNSTNGESYSKRNFARLINGTTSKVLNFTANLESNKISITWSSEGEPNAYYVFTSNSSDIATFNFSISSYSISTKNWTDTNDSWEKYYVVRSKDVVGNLDNNTIIIGKTTAELKKGLNLVSIPLNVPNYSISHLINQNSTRHPITEISERSPDGSYRIATYYPGNGWWSPQGFDTLMPGKGYWVKTENDFNLTLVGFVYNQTLDTNISFGLNLVGWSSTTPKKIQDVVNQSNIIEISNRKDDGSYEIATYYPGNGWWSPQGFDTLMPGKAYWVKANNASKWKFGIVN